DRRRRFDVKADADEDHQGDQHPDRGESGCVHVRSPQRAADLTAAEIAALSLLPTSCSRIAPAVLSAIAPTSFIADALIEAMRFSGSVSFASSSASIFLRDVSASALAVSRACWPMVLALALASASSCS